MVSEKDGDSLNSQVQRIENPDVDHWDSDGPMKLTYERALSSEVNFVCAYDHPYFHHMEKVKEPELFSL